MQKHTMTIVAAIAIGGLPISVAAAAEQQRAHHHVRAAVHDGYIMNGDFDWRRLRPGEKMPWYARGYSNDCVAWTPHAYHYACDPNGRY